MTWGGGKPHINFGDRGQRYEVRFTDSSGQQRVFGWSNDQAGADTLVKSIQLHPSWHSPIVVDRNPQ